jgi:hypothetical protein
MPRIASWVATLPDGSKVVMGSTRTVAEIPGPYRLEVEVEGGRHVALDVGDGQRANVFTRVMKRRDGSELMVPVINLEGVRAYLHPDGDVVTTEDLYW